MTIKQSEISNFGAKCMHMRFGVTFKWSLHNHTANLPEAIACN